MAAKSLHFDEFDLYFARAALQASVETGEMERRRQQQQQQRPRHSASMRQSSFKHSHRERMTTAAGTMTEQATLPRRAVSCKYPSHASRYRSASAGPSSTDDGDSVVSSEFAVADVDGSYDGFDAASRTSLVGGVRAAVMINESPSVASSTVGTETATTTTSSGRALVDGSLCAPLLSAWSKSSSAPQSRSSSWKKKQRSPFEGFVRRPRSFKDTSDPRHAGAAVVGASSARRSTGSNPNVAGNGSHENLEEAVIQKLQQLRSLQRDDCCVVRSFTTSAKGIVSRGDKFKRLSVTPAASAAASGITGRDTTAAFSKEDAGGGGASACRTLANGFCPASTAARGQPVEATVGAGVWMTPVEIHRVLVVGQANVGKTALLQQFMTSHYMAAVCTSFGRCLLLCSIEKFCYTYSIIFLLCRQINIRKLVSRMRKGNNLQQRTPTHLFYLRPFVMRSEFNKLKLSAKKAESEAHV